MFRLAQTVPDGVRALVQAGGFPFDCAGRRPIYRIRMACKRSGVQISLAPPRSETKFERFERRVQQESSRGDRQLVHFADAGQGGVSRTPRLCRRAGAEVGSG